MKKLLLLLTFFTATYFLQAQYCGNSGSAQCTPIGGFVTPGFYPTPSQLSPFINGQASTTVLEFKNFNVVNFAGNNYTVNWLRIDSVGNLPSGLCWASNQANNTFLNQEEGCVRLNGTPNGTPGEYKIRILVTANVIFGASSQSIQIDASVAGTNYFVRLIDSCQTAPETDTLQTADFVAYNIPGCFYVNLGADQNSCRGSIVTLSPTTLSGRPPFTFAWQSSGDTVSCDTCQNPSVLLTQNSTFIVTATDSFNVVDRDTISFTPSGAPFDFSISSSSADTFCAGGSVTLNAHESPTRTYQWQLNGNAISGANDSTYTVSDSTGNYNVLFTDTGNCTATSNLIPVVVNPLPAVSFVLNPNTVCSNAAAFSITGASPSGGTFAGIGVSGNTFDPATASIGSSVLTYSYTDLNGCSATARDTIQVTVCSGLEEVNTESTLLVYPNPATDELTVESNLFLNSATVLLVYDVTGKLVSLNFTHQANRIVFDVTEIPTGVYVLKMKAGEKQLINRFVKGF